MAYAYLTYNPGKVLDSVAHKRLQAIKEFTEFGSGFKIAMRDLEIRGAGNLLGKEQHGNMNLVGYDMYCMLLEQAVKEEKGETYRPPLEITVDVRADAYIPDTYVEYEQQRIDLYKKIATIETEQDYYDMQAEFLDRFGDLPQSVSNLIDISLIKSMCRTCEISELVQKENVITFSFTDFANPDAVVKLISESTEDIEISVADRLIMFAIDGYTFISRLLEGEFVNYKKTIPLEFRQNVTVKTNDFIDVIERVSLLISDSFSTPVRCIFNEDHIVLSSATAMGRATDTFLVTLEGDPFEIGLNSRYLLEALRAVEDDNVKILFNGSNAGVIIRSSDESNEDYLYMIMPMRLK